MYSNTALFQETGSILKSYIQITNSFVDHKEHELINLRKFDVALSLSLDHFKLPPFLVHIISCNAY